ncbi:DUF4123 domain-containing protein [Zestomonas carbonaria]|uniref:DUF4123 domain-containing protein n=1 Tax=Zestomonas carbonaria TaxID=2762745 RepID=A0A7U7ICG6_9GAMM|nr:DUF4123 domain-containing protein [Pseudomonas carbonaria]CAD5110607.1 hypothetical protein PSEWESI4_04930 [Pseudomonas carbonaria]
MNASLPVMLGNVSPREALPTTPRTYLLLITKVLEDWAYRPVPEEGELVPPEAPGVMDLVRAVESFPRRCWIWKGGPLDDVHERGPLLVEATDSPALLDHALTAWAPTGGVLFIGSAAERDELCRHLGSLVRIRLPDQGEATLNLRPDLLSAWLRALDDDHRHAWLGPMTQLLWRINWGPAHGWCQLDQPVPGLAQRTTGWLELRPHELAAFDTNTREHFVTSLAHELITLPSHSSRALGEVREWVRQQLREASTLNIQADADARRYILLLARYPGLLDTPQAQALINDLSESPPARLRGLAALAGEKEFPDD